MTGTERLRAVAAWYRQNAEDLPERASRECRALADLFDGIAERHTPVGPSYGRYCKCCGVNDLPCPDVRAALAVAGALGLGESQGDSTGLPGTGRVQ